MDAADLLERADVRRVALGELDQRGIGEHRPDRPILVGRGALAPRRELARDRAGARVELPDARQPLPGRVRVALVGGRLEPAALLARPAEPAGLAQPALDLVGELEQVRDVLGGVAELLGGQRPGVPARVARGLADPAAEHRPEQVAVAGLRARAREPRRELGVEDVRDLGAPRPAQDRHVLAAGVEHDLDRRVGEQLRERRHVDPVERVDQRDVRGVVRVLVVDRDLHQAQQRPVAALGHELGVDPDPAVRAGGARGRRHLVGARERLGGVAAACLRAHRG